MRVLILSKEFFALLCLQLSSVFTDQSQAYVTNLKYRLVSANRLSIYGVVADLCEEFPQTLVGPNKTHVVEGQSESHGSTHRPVRPSQAWSQPGSQLPTKRGILMNSQSEVKLDIEAYTPPWNDPSFEPKGWIRESTRKCPAFKVNTNYHQGKPGIEIRNESLSGDHSQSWVGISNGLNKFVRDLTEKSRIPDEEENDSPRTEQPGLQELRIESNSWKQSERPSAKAKLGPSSSSSSQEHISIHEKIWCDVEPDTNHNSTLNHDISKKMTTLLQHEEREVKKRRNWSS